MKVLIIEDEKIAAENLKLMLGEIDSDIKILESIESIRKAVSWLKDHTCDLIFMDIQLSDGNSFSIFDQIEVKTPVIFTTAYDQYAIKAFKHNSIHYLLKPIHKDDLSNALKKYYEWHEQKNLPNLQQLLESIHNPFQYRERFLVGAGAKLKSIKVNDIAYFYVQAESTFVCTKQNKHYDLNFTLDKLEEILDPNMFFRINRQYIVNIDSIGSMITVTKSRLQLELSPKPEGEVIVSVNNVHDFKNWLNK